DRDRGEHQTVERVRRQPAKLPPWREDGGDSLLALEVNPPICKHRGCRVVSAQPFLPEYLSGRGVKTSGDADVTHHVEFITDKNRRRCVGGATLHRPGYVGFGHIAFTVGVNSQQGGLLKSGRDVDKPVAI